jgi:hypothetical protein
VCICLTPSCTTQNTQRRAEEHKIHTNLDQQLWQQYLTNKLQLGQQKLTEAINAEKRREQKKHAEQVQESLLAVGEKMNFADQYLEEYGSSSISVPLLAKLGEDFTFNLKQGGTNYYNDAKTQVQGAAAAFDQTIQSFSFAGQANLDPTVAAGYAAQLGDYFSSLERYKTKQNLQDQAALQQLHAALATANTNPDPAAKQAATAQALQAYAQQYSAPTNVPSFPTDGGSSSNLPSVTIAAARPGVTNVLSAQQFLPFQGLLSGLNVQPTISDRAAIITAAGDVATESIFRHFLGSTNASSDAADNIYFGLSTVSVSPGWRTSKGWAAEVIMSADVTWTNARLAVIKRVFNIASTINKARMYYTYGPESLPYDEAAMRMVTDQVVTGRRVLSSYGYSNLLTNLLTNTPLSLTTITPTNTLTTNRIWQLFLTDRTPAADPKRPLPSTLQPRIVTNIVEVINTAETYRANGKTNIAGATSLNNIPFDPVALDLAREYLSTAHGGMSLDDFATSRSRFLSNQVVSHVTFAYAPYTQTVHFSSQLLAKAQYYRTTYITNLNNLGDNKIVNPDQDAVTLAADALSEGETNITNYVSKMLKVGVSEEDYNGNGDLLLAVDSEGSFPPSAPLPVTIISPLIDSDVEDLSSSQRSQAEFAVALSFALRYAGLGAQASAFEQFVKNKQFDIRTRSQQISVSAFSGTDGKYGFQVGPRLQAIGDPTGKNKGASQVLERQSFPALLILQLGDVDLQPKLWMDTNKHSYYVLEPQITFSQMRRWTEVRSHAFPRRQPFSFFAMDWLCRPISEKRRLLAAAKLNAAQYSLTKVALSLDEILVKTLQKRIENLKSQMVGGEGKILLSAKDIVPDTTKSPEPVAITSVYPSDVLLITPSTNTLSLVYLGTGLGAVSDVSANTTVITNILATSGVDVSLLQSNVTVKRVNQALTLEAKFARTDRSTNTFALMFELTTTNKAKVLTPPVYVRYVPAALPAQTTPVLHITQSADSAGRAVDYKVEVGNRAFPGEVETAAKLIETDMEKNKPHAAQSSNTVMSILVNESKPGRISATASASVTNAPSAP